MSVRTAIFVSFFGVFVLLVSRNVDAHCDTLDGPVIADAATALKTGDVTPVLKWVGEDSEGKIRQAFDKALKDRSADEAARERADTRFYETLIRVHRTGEGETFTGLKPAGTAEPALIAADQALAKGSVTELSDELTGAVREGLRQRFADALGKKKHADDSVEAGRAYVAAYVAYAHYVEAIHALDSSGSEEHSQQPHTESNRRQNKP